MAQQARNMSMVFDDEQDEHKPTHVIRDRDSKFTAQFCSILESEGIEFRPIPPRSPNMNPHAEAWVQRTKHEVLNHFVIFGERHLRYLIFSWLDYYHRHRPHQGLGNRLLTGSDRPPESAENTPLGPAGLPKLTGLVPKFGQIELGRALAAARQVDLVRRIRVGGKVVLDGRPGRRRRDAELRSQLRVGQFGLLPTVKDFRGMFLRPRG